MIGIVSGINNAAGTLTGALGNIIGYCRSAADSMYNAFNIGWYYIGYNIVDGKPHKMLPDGEQFPIMAVQALLAHNIKEFTNLAAILPELYAEFKDKF